MGEPVQHDIFKSSFVDSAKCPSKGEGNQSGGTDGTQETPRRRCPGHCSAYCVDKDCLRAEIKKPPLTTSQVYSTTCDLPKRFEHPHWFNGYGSQMSKEHPFYRTTSSEYGWYPPGVHCIPSVFFPSGQEFTNRLAAGGMYRNYGLNTGMDQSGFF